MFYLKKLLKLTAWLLLLATAFYAGSIVSDKRTLSENLIRLHVVADSDSKKAQENKLYVRDAIVEYLQPRLEEFADMDAAKEYIQQKIPELQELANDVLRKLGDGCKAVVTIAKEAFPTREYDTFTLPAGIYESLRVTIGEGEGKNWWCVVFPALCVGATSDGFEDTAVSAGFSDTLSGSLTGKPQYQVRFFILDCWGWIENHLWKKA